MKKQGLSALLVVLLLMGTLCVPAFGAARSGENLLRDPNFSEGFTAESPWQMIYGSNVFTQSKETPNGQGNSAKIEFTKNARTDGIRQTCYAPKAGTYVFSVYLKASVSNMATIVKLGNMTSGSHGMPIPTQWTKVTVEFNAQAGQSFIAEVLVGNIDAGSSVLIAQPELTLVGGGSIDPVYGNLLENGGFESALNQWNVRGNAAGVSVNRYVANQGFQSLALSCQTETGRGYVEQEVEAPHEGLFTLSAAFKKQTTNSDASLRLLLYVQAKDASGEVVASNYVSAVPNSQGNWGTASCSVNVPAEATTINVQVQSFMGYGTLYVDDVVLEYAG